MNDKRANAEAVANAYHLNSLPEAIDYLKDDRSHGDEAMAEIAARLARERWAGRPPEGDREAAVLFIMEVQELADKAAKKPDAAFLRDLKTMEIGNLRLFGKRKRK